MEISFADETVEALCGQAKRATKALGAESAKKLQRRMTELFNAENVLELVAGRPHPLQGARAGTFALDLHGGSVWFSNRPCNRRRQKKMAVSIGHP